MIIASITIYLMYNIDFLIYSSQVCEKDITISIVIMRKVSQKETN